MRKNLYTKIIDFHGAIYLLLVLTLTFFNLTPLIPCNVPVFRYALERWTADPYRLTVFYKGQINQTQQQDLDDLKRVSFAGDSTLNLIIEYRDLDHILGLHGIRNSGRIRKWVGEVLIDAIGQGQIILYLLRQGLPKSLKGPGQIRCSPSNI